MEKADIYMIEIRIVRTRVQFEIERRAYEAAEKAVAEIRETTDPRTEGSVERLLVAECELDAIRQVYRDSLRKLSALEFEHRHAIREAEVAR